MLAKTGCPVANGVWPVVERVVVLVAETEVYYRCCLCLVVWRVLGYFAPVVYLVMVGYLRLSAVYLVLVERSLRVRLVLAGWLACAIGCLVVWPVLVGLRPGLRIGLYEVRWGWQRPLPVVSGGLRIRFLFLEPLRLWVGLMNRLRRLAGKNGRLGAKRV